MEEIRKRNAAMQAMLDTTLKHGIQKQVDLVGMAIQQSMDVAFLLEWCKAMQGQAEMLQVIKRVLDAYNVPAGMLEEALDRLARYERIEQEGRMQVLAPAGG